MNKSSLTAVALSAAVLGTAVGATSPDMADVESNFISLEIEQIENPAAVRDFALSLRDDGTWADVDYNDRNGTVWTLCSKHLGRLLNIARLWHREPSADLEAAFHRALGWWLQESPTVGNWWWNDIGVPEQLGAAALCGRALLTNDELNGIVEILKRHPISMTGQNRIWLARIALMRAILTDNEQLLSDASDAISGEIRFGGVEGIQHDWSFHQHGNQPQFGNYGLSFAVYMTKLAFVFSGTRFAFPQEKTDMLNNLFEHGFAWAIWNGRLDISCVQRQFWPNAMASKGRKILNSAAMLGRCGGESERIAADFAAGKGPIGFKCFPSSAMSFYRQNSWMASHKGGTKSIRGVETWVIGDNVLGQHQQDGSLCVSVTGAEYEDVFALWNWRKLPGITSCIDLPPSSYNDSKEPFGPNHLEDYHGEETANGGVVTFGVSREGISYRQHIEFTPDGILATTTDIVCTNDSRVATCVEAANASENACVISQTDTETRLRNGAIEYIVYAPKDSVEVFIGEREGDFHTFMRGQPSTIHKGRIFEVTVNHGVKPRGASCRYRIIPCKYEMTPDDAPCSRSEEVREAEVLRELFSGIANLSCGETAYKAISHGDNETAVREIAHYFRNRKCASLYKAKPTKCNFSIADRAVAGDVTVVNIPYPFKDGKIDWFFNPTGKNGLAHNSEWHLQLNRMYFWKDMADAYALTGDEKYAIAFREQLRSWIASTEPRGGGGYVTWRTLEVGIRLQSWTYAFERFRHSPNVTDMDICLMLGSLIEQRRHVMAHRGNGGNWLIIQMNGVYTFSALFPELGESEMYRREASRILCEQLAAQVLPDGYQYELTPDYHLCAWKGFATVYRLGRAFGELPADYGKNLEKLADAMLNLSTPGFTEPCSNDSFVIETEQFMKEAAELFPNRRDFLWAHTRREKGEEPKGVTASRILPWAGYAAMRSDWSADASYMMFDFGPLGFGHYHQDKLNIVMFKGDEELIFDDGGGQYESSDYRRYAICGRGHNTLLVDGCPQLRKEPFVMKAPIDVGWITTPEYDYIRGTYDQGYEGGGKQVAQTREIRFDRQSDTFTITDTIDAKDGVSHNYELLFQLDTTNAVVSADGKHVHAEYGSGRKWALDMSFKGADEVRVVSAQLKPFLAGWYVGRNNRKVHPSTTVFVKAAEKTDHVFETVLKAVSTVR